MVISGPALEHSESLSRVEWLSKKRCLLPRLTTWAQSSEAHGRTESTPESCPLTPPCTYAHTQVLFFNVKDINTLSQETKIIVRQWWYKPFVPAQGGWGRPISELESSLIYRASSRAARVTERNPVLKKKNYKRESLVFLWLWTTTAKILVSWYPTSYFIITIIIVLCGVWVHIYDSICTEVNLFSSFLSLCWGRISDVSSASLHTTA